MMHPCAGQADGQTIVYSSACYRYATISKLHLCSYQLWLHSCRPRSAFIPSGMDRHQNCIPLQ